MPDGKIRISIGATQDRSVEVVFGNLEKRAAKARENITKAFAGTSSAGGSNNALGKPFEVAAKQATASSKQIEKTWGDQMRALNNYARAQDREWKRSAQERIRTEQAAAKERVKSEQEASRAIVKEFKAQVREREREIERGAAREVSIRQRFASRTSQRAVKFLFPPPSGIIGAAGRVAGDFARGAGIDFDIGSSVQRTVGLSSRITQLQNQAALNDQNVSHGNLEASIKGASDKYGFDRSTTADALGKFADKTGDMGLGMQILSKMAERAAASGGNVEDMMDAAGDVAMNLGPVKDKAKALTGVMDQMTVQGAKGAIEMKNLAASGMSRIASSAGRFEGDAGGNMIKLGALAQLARQSGGASSASEAATAVARLTDQFVTPARAKQFTSKGISLTSAKEHGQIRDPLEIIKDALLKTNGNPDELHRMFASSIGAKPVNALAKEFNAAGGGQAGIAAVDKLLQSFMGAADIQKKLDEANARRDQETATKAQKFQNKLDDITQRMSAKMLPTLERLEGPALKLADALASLANTALDNPIKTVILAITAAVARAGLESALRASLERAIMGSGSGLLPGRGVDGSGAALAGGGGVWAGRGMKLLGAVGAGMAGAGLGATAGGLLGGEGGAQTGAYVGGGIGFGGQLAGPWGAAAGATTGLAIDQQQKLDKESAGVGFWGTIFGGGFGEVDRRMNEQAKARAAADGGAAPNQQPVDPTLFTRGIADGIATKTLRVQVVNPKDFAGNGLAPPRVSPDGRSAP